MNRFKKCLVVVFVIAIPIWHLPVIINDLTHPELWNDWQHDPRWYGPLLLVTIAVMVELFASAIRWQRRWERMSPKERLKESHRLAGRRWF